MATIDPENHKGCTAIRGRLHGSFGPKAEHIELDKLKREKRKAQIENEGRRQQSQLHFCTLILRGKTSFTQLNPKGSACRVRKSSRWSPLELSGFIQSEN